MVTKHCPDGPTCGQVEELLTLRFNLRWLEVSVDIESGAVSLRNARHKTWVPARQEIQEVAAQARTVGTPEWFAAKLMSTIDGKPANLNELV